MGNQNNLSVECTCPTCTKSFTISIPESEYNAWTGGARLQDAAKSLDDFEREALMTGMCFDCQERVFNRPTKMHAKEWGPRMGECCVCGAPVYSIRNKVKDKANRWQCGSCNEILAWSSKLNGFDVIEE